MRKFYKLLTWQFYMATTWMVWCLNWGDWSDLAEAAVSWQRGCWESQDIVIHKTPRSCLQCTVFSEPLLTSQHCLTSSVTEIWDKQRSQKLKFSPGKHHLSAFEKLWALANSVGLLWHTGLCELLQIETINLEEILWKWICKHWNWG